MDENDRGNFDPLRQAPPSAQTQPTEPEADLKAASDDLRKLDRGVPPGYQKQGRDHHSIYVILGVILALALIAAGSYWFLHKSKNAANTPPKANTTLKTQQDSQASDIRITDVSTTKNYSSTNFGLSFTYPADWTVTDGGNGILTAKSPVVSFGSITGQVVLTIRDSSQKLSEFGSTGKAIAERDSEKIAYTKPTQTQRANTYLSYLTFPSTNNGVSGLYITGDDGYQKGQTVPASDVSQVDPIVSIGFTKSGAPINILDDELSNNNFLPPLKSILESLSIN